jgi:hypothetical protein
MAKQPGYAASVLLTGAAVTMTGESMSVVSGTAYEIDDATKDIFDPDTAMVVEASEDSGSTYATLGTDEYDIKFLLGRIDINNYTSGSGNTANITNVRIDGAYLPRFTLANARSVDFEPTRAMADASVFRDEGERRVGLRLDFSSTIESLAQGQVPLDGSGGTEDSILDLVLSATRTVLQVTPTGTASDFVLRSFVKIESDGISVPGDDLVSASISMQGALPDSATSNQTVNLFNYK